MNSPSDLIDALPDLAVLLRRDGTVLSYAGGCDVQALRPARGCEEKSLEEIWPAAFAQLVKRLMRRALATRTSAEAEFLMGALRYEARVTPQGPDRVICMVRSPLPTLRNQSVTPHDVVPPAHLDRRGFLRRLKESMSIAALNERPFSIALIHVDGVVDISQVIDTRASDQILGSAVRRIPLQPDTAIGAEPQWYMGQFGENQLVLVLQSSNRDLIEACVTRVCVSLREPVSLGDAVFHLTPYAGVAILGQDAAAPNALLDHARASAIEARRSGSMHVHFFSDTLKLRSFARLDIARELSTAIETRQIRLRYSGRHDLASDRLVALVGYLHWTHPLRGVVRPREFLSVAETTGLATALSRSVLECLREDFAELKHLLAPEVRVSFGALRHHILTDNFLGDIRNFIAETGIPPERLELRIAERSHINRDASTWQSLAHLGVQLTVDEVGRKLSSLDLLARAPLWGLQLDRSWVAAAELDPAALRVCRAAISMARALHLTPIATGIDNAAQRDTLIELGCVQGLGDFYNAVDAAVLGRRGFTDVELGQGVKKHLRTAGSAR